MFKNGFKILGRILGLNKMQAPPLSWRTSSVGAMCRNLKNSIMDVIRPNKAGKAFSYIMSRNPNVEEAKRACSIFERETGIKMFVTNPRGAISFNNNANTIIRDIREGFFPKDIKYVIVGHGDGSVLNDTWHVEYSPEVKIFDFINKNVPKGEKVLVNCCERTPNELRAYIPKDKPAIGNYVTEMYSSYYHPAKIVISGQNEIIGGYANGIATYYK